MQDDIVDVLVSEGVVEVVTRADEQAVQPGSNKHSIKIIETVTLEQAGAVSYDRSIESVDYIAEKEIKDILAWKRGRWIFEGEPLSDVVIRIRR